MTTKININKNKLLTELCLKQRKKADKKYFLELNDIIRLLKNIDNSIFNQDDCVIWKGYLTKCNNNKSCYVNFYLKKRKLALHRILYINFIDDLDVKHYLKFTCDNPGKCCNINHIVKVCDDIIENIPNIITNIINPDISNDISNNQLNNISNNINLSIISSKKNLSSNIKITKIDNVSKSGKIVIIFDD
jgi:hypothetical protein